MVQDLEDAIVSRITRDFRTHQDKVWVELRKLASEIGLDPESSVLTHFFEDQETVLWCVFVCGTKVWAGDYDWEARTLVEWEDPTWEGDDEPDQELIDYVESLRLQGLV